ncbi:MAG: glycosyltransferase family 2 protein, partial [Calothrix sp. SM1_7_51]|nr:glycosyltransferase family 2 protein [Calothrix sp. SM1_7_51]
MPANSWPGDDSYDDRDAIDRVSTEINSLLADLSTQENTEEDTEVDTEVDTLDPLTLPFRFKNRRRKAAIALSIVWSGTIALHLVSWGTFFVLGL